MYTPLFIVLCFLSFFVYRLLKAISVCSKRPNVSRLGSAIWVALDLIGIVHNPLTVLKRRSRKPIASKWAYSVENIENDLSYIGKSAFASDHVDMLENYKILHEEYKEAFELVSPPSLNVIFIVGMPRSGTTKLHHYLGTSCGDLLSLSFGRNATPFPLESTRKNLKSLLGLRLASVTTDIQHKHHLDYNMPDEEIHLMTKLCGYPDNRLLWINTLPSEHYYNCPKSRREMATIAYECLRKYLCLAQYCWSVSNDRHWILKSPVHLYPENLNALLKVFPNAKFIHTVRPDHERTVASYCSLSWSAQSIFLKSVDKKAVKANVLEHLRNIRQGELALDDVERCAEIHFDELVHNVKEASENALSALGVDCTLNEADDHQKAPKHIYSLEEYGITSSDIDYVFDVHIDDLIKSPSRTLLDDPEANASPVCKKLSRSC